MNTAEIRVLKMMAERGGLIWAPEETAYRKVSRIGAAPKPDEGDEPEPSEVAYLVAGGYVALYNCDFNEFGVLTMLDNHGATYNDLLHGK